MPTLQDKEEQDKKYNPAENRYGEHDDLGVHPERREAEVDDLENLYNAESRADGDRNTGAGRAAQSEQSALSDKTAASQPEATWKTDTEGNDKSRLRLRMDNRRALISGGLLGVLIGGGIGFFAFMSGPLQFLQFAQLLQRFHFDSSERFGNSRTSKLYRWATNRPQNAQNYNLSRKGTKVAIHYEKKLSAAGIDIEYNDSGRMSRMIVDPNTPTGKKIVQGIESENGVAMPKDPADGKVRLEFAANSSEVTSAGVRRKMISGAVNAMGMNDISSSIARRMLKKRAGVDFHPLKNVTRSADEKLRLRYDEWKQRVKEERNKSIKEGADPPDVSTGQRQDDPDKPASETDRVASAEVDGEVDDIKNIAKDTNVPFKERVAGVKAKIGVGVGAAAIVGTVCGLDALGDASAELQEQNINLPLIRTAMTGVITPASQIMSGQDVSMDEIGALSDSFYDKETKTSWMSAESIQANLGTPNTGVKIPDSAKPGKDKPQFFSVIDTITSAPGASQICSAINSTLGGFAVTIAGIAVGATGPFAVLLNVGSEAGQQVLANAFMDDLVRWLAGDAVDVSNAAGGTFGALADTGAFLADNNTMMAMGGRALTSTERVALATETSSLIKERNKQKSFYARVFDVKSPDSLASKSIIQNDGIRNTQTSFASLLRSPFSALSSVGSSLSALNPRVHAQTVPYDYGVDQIGFSISERDSKDLEDPYANAAIVEPKLSDLNNKYGTVCFGTTIDPSTGRVSYTSAPSYSTLEDNKAVCGSDNKDPDFLRYRMYVADAITLTTISCYESIDETDCQDIGLTGSESQPTTAPAPTPTNTSCAEGSRSLGQADGYINGVKQVITLCAIDELPVQAIDSDGAESTPRSKYYINGAEGKAIVSSKISSQVVSMVRKAKSDGINLVAISSFRTNEHQIEACKPQGNKCGNSGYAMPGMSAHQSGEAIDFLDSNRNRTANCKNSTVNGRCVGTDPGWNWLSKNAESFGLKQLLSESWHWSTSGN